MVLSILFIVGVVEVRQAQGMAEFVASGADTAHIHTFNPLEFGGYEILRQLEAVEGGIPGFGRGRTLHIPLVRPEGILMGAFGLVVTGIIDDDHIYLPVVVGVVLGKVHAAVQQNGGIIHGNLRSYVVLGNSPAVVLDRLHPELVKALAVYVAARADDPKRDRLVVNSVYAKKALVKYGKLNAVTVDELAASCL